METVTKQIRDKYRPAVTKNVLLLLAGLVWFLVGVALVIVSVTWLTAAPVHVHPLAFAGIMLALLVHHLGFLRIVDKNLNRLLSVSGLRCVFGFIPWRSYLIILIMIAMGWMLRHSVIPKHDVAVIYLGIGLALVLSSLRYFRFFFRLSTE